VNESHRELELYVMPSYFCHFLSLCHEYPPLHITTMYSGVIRKVNSVYKITTVLFQLSRKQWKIQKFVLNKSVSILNTESSNTWSKIHSSLMRVVDVWEHYGRVFECKQSVFSRIPAGEYCRRVSKKNPKCLKELIRFSFHETKTE